METWLTTGPVMRVGLYSGDDEFAAPEVEIALSAHGRWEITGGTKRAQATATDSTQTAFGGGSAPLVPAERTGVLGGLSFYFSVLGFTVVLAVAGMFCCCDGPGPTGPCCTEVRRCCLLCIYMPALDKSLFALYIHAGAGYISLSDCRCGAPRRRGVNGRRRWSKSKSLWEASRLKRTLARRQRAKAARQRVCEMAAWSLLSSVQVDLDLIRKADL